MSICARTAATAATSRRLLSSVRWSAASASLSARHIWLNATSMHSTSTHFSLRPPSHPSSPPLRHFSSTSSPSPSTPPTPPTTPSDSPLLAVHSMSELRDTVDQAGTNTLVILEWKATWCSKCKTVAAQLSRLQSLHPSVVVRTVDIDEGDLMEGKREAGIDHIPVLHFIKGGELVHEIVGVRINEMAKTVEKYAGDQSTSSS